MWWCQIQAIIRLFHFHGNSYKNFYINWMIETIYQPFYQDSDLSNSSPPWIHDISCSSSFFFLSRYLADQNAVVGHVFYLRVVKKWESFLFPGHNFWSFLTPADIVNKHVLLVACFVFLSLPSSHPQIPGQTTPMPAAAHLLYFPSLSLKFLGCFFFLYCFLRFNLYRSSFEVHKPQHHIGGTDFFNFTKILKKKNLLWVVKSGL